MNFVFAQLDWQQVFQDEFKAKEEKINQYGNYTDQMKIDLVKTTQQYRDTLRDEIGDTFMTIVKNDREEFNADANKKLNRIFMYVADEMGYLKLFNLTNLVRSIAGLEKVPNQVEGRAFNPRRQEIIDTALMAQQIRKSLSNKNTELPPALDPE